MMLKEKSSPWARLKYLYVLPVAAIAVTAFARPEISNTMEEISVVKVNDLTAIVETKVAESVADTSKQVKKQELAGKVITVRRGSKLPADSLEEVVVVGYGTLSDTGKDPLYIVDGLPVSKTILRSIKPDRIASVSVLKDDAATAVYGEKGANGVILMTLKNDEVGLGKDSYLDLGSVTKQLNGKMTYMKSNTSASVSIRGVGNLASRNSDKDALYVDDKKVEGGSISDLSPDQIESISIKKNEEGGGNVYVTTKKPGTVYVETTSAKGNMKVEGSVTDERGKPVIGATVIVEGTPSGAITDVDGNFVISTKKGSTLVVSYIGMNKVKVKAAPKLAVTLKTE